MSEKFGDHFAEETNKYDLAWEKRNEARNKAKEIEQKKVHQAILDGISPGFSFEGEKLKGYQLSFQGEKLDMNFKNFEAIVNAVSVIAKMKLIYENEFSNTEDKPKFYAEKGELKIDNNYILGLFGDTTYLSRGFTKYFLARMAPDSTEGTKEIQRLADYLNKVIVNNTLKNLDPNTEKNTTAIPNPSEETDEEYSNRLATLSGMYAEPEQGPVD